MNNDIRLVEDGIKKDAKASQQKFAKEVAEDVTLSVVEEMTSVVNQLDNKTTISQIKTKLEKIKEYLELLNIHTLLDSIDEMKECVTFEQNTIRGIDEKMANHLDNIQGVLNAVLEIDSQLKTISNRIESELFKKVLDIFEFHDKKSDSAILKQDDILKNIENIKSLMEDESGVCTIELLKSCDSMINELKNKIEKIDSVISDIDAKQQFEVSQDILDKIEQDSNVLDELKEEIIGIKVCIQEGFTCNDKQLLLSQIDELRTRMKWSFLLNGITVIGIISILVIQLLS